MIDKYEQAYKSLFALNEEFKNIDITSFNEATTRFRFIDRVLTECLVWDHLNITTEDSFDGEYSDYTFHLFRPVAILEAKKTGNYFELPLGIKSSVIPIKTLIKDNSNLKPIFDKSVDIVILGGFKLQLFLMGGNLLHSLLIGQILFHL